MLLIDDSPHTTSRAPQHSWLLLPHHSPMVQMQKNRAAGKANRVLQLRIKNSTRSSRGLVDQQTMLNKYEVPPQVDTRQAIPPLGVRLRRRREQRGRVGTTVVLRVALIAAAIAATAFLVLSCFRQATSRVSNPAYRRRLSERRDPQGQGDPSSSDLCQSTAESSEGGQQTGSSQTSEGHGSPQQKDGATGGAGEAGGGSQEVPMGSAEEGPEVPPEGLPQGEVVQASGPPLTGAPEGHVLEVDVASAAGASASGAAEGGQEQLPPPPSPPRKRKRKTKHLESTGEEGAQPSTSTAATAAHPGEGESSEEQKTAALRFANLNVLARLTSQAVAGAKKAHQERAPDLEGRLELLRLFELFLRRELGVVKDQIFPLVRPTPTYIASLEFAAKVLDATLKNMDILGISPSMGGPEEQQTEPLIKAVLQVAYLTARMRFAVKTMLDAPTSRRYEHLKTLFLSSSGMRSTAEAAAGRSRGPAVAVAMQVLERELLDLLDCRAIAASALSAPGPIPPPPQPPGPLFAAPPRPSPLSQVDSMVERMMQLAQNLQSVLNVQGETHPSLFQAAVAGFVRQALEMVDMARSLQAAGVLTPREAADVATATTVLEEVVNEAFSRQS
ncbi:hypothetical protein ACSSS7_007905 [Eimeria intestinalis]